MAPQPAPISDLARMYRERIPTAPKSIGRLGPVQIGGGGNWFTNAARKIGGGLVDIVESLDPRVIASEGGRSVQHVVGDVTELGRSILTGEDTLSQSPTARAYQAAGGGAPGVLAAALPYVNVGTAVLPTTRVLTPAGRLAMSADIDRSVYNRVLSEGIESANPSQRIRLIAPEQPARSNEVFSVKYIQRPDGSYGLATIDNRSGDVIGSMHMAPEGNQMLVTGMVSENPMAMLKMLAAAQAKAAESIPNSAFPLLPDDSLSAYSRPLVERLQAAGLVDPDYVLPDIEDLNDVTKGAWMPGRFAVDVMLGEGTEIPFSQYQDVYDSVRQNLLASRRQAVAEGRGRLTTSSQQITGDPLAIEKRIERITPDLMARSAELMPNGQDGVNWLVTTLTDGQFGIAANAAVNLGKTDEVLQVTNLLVNAGVITEMERDLLLNNILRIMRQTDPNAGRLPNPR